MIRVGMWFVDVAGVDVMMTIGVLLRGLAAILVLLVMIPFSIELVGSISEYYAGSVFHKHRQLSFINMWSLVYDITAPLILAFLAWAAALDLKAVPVAQHEKFDWKFRTWPMKLGAMVIILAVVQYYNWNASIWLWIKTTGYPKAIWDHVAYVELLLLGALCFYASVKISISRRIRATLNTS